MTQSSFDELAAVIDSSWIHSRYWEHDNRGLTREGYRQALTDAQSELRTSMARAFKLFEIIPHIEAAIAHDDYWGGGTGNE